MNDQKEEAELSKEADQVGDEAEKYLTPPENTKEAILHNFRPKPVIPALVAFVLCLLLLKSSPIIAAIALVAAYGLMVGAGFCSFFPQMFSMGFSYLLFDVINKAGGPEYLIYIIYFGVITSVAMLILQFHRVKTAKFVPLIDRRPKEENF